MTYGELGDKVKEKYPQYAGVDSTQLGQKVAAKYPQYASKVTVEPPAPNPNGATFAYKGDGGTAERTGLKALGNVPSSAFNLAKTLGKAVLNPIDTAKAIGGTVAGGYQMLGKELGVNLGQNFIPQAEQTGRALGQRFGVDKLAQGDVGGAINSLARTATEDPVGFGADILGGAEAVGKAAGLRTGAVTEAVVSKTARPVVNAAAAAARGAKNAAAGTAKFGVGQATGLAPETLAQIADNPQAFTAEARAGLSREAVAGDFLSKLDARLDDLSDLGKGYEAARKSAEVLTTPRAGILRILEENGLSVKGVVDPETGGTVSKVIFSKESKPLSGADIKSLEDFLNTYADSPNLSANAFLNAREAAAKISRFDQGNTQNLARIGKEIYAEMNKAADRELPVIRNLDAQYAPERELLGQVKRDFFDATGNLKDGAISRIANSTGKGKERLIQRLEQIDPTIGQRVRVLKAVEDIAAATGQKVGTYTRAGLAVGGFMTGNVPAAIAAILSTPEIAVPLIRAMGIAKSKIAPMLQFISAAANDVNNFRLPPPLSPYISQYASQLSAYAPAAAEVIGAE